ncbi:DMSO/TMAO reductase YedYZ molybdopterin-dependent catalytic subunit [Paenibacillus cellulosilyticus]|uniref:DMSO/TMAO reductase YedYZ molybdopterin-dependent catalytic subunit n=1 Tax=Paenibacillus cellulosilyticus TaxID=375489 RepID=A0A2V2YVS6_9BACL|nr:molybdopterin-dependent oxidoreductase [Paenibacillus cellulosilyticus]PWW05248.1 DMSO/TMAO reductase YedYZ molybdopterin-dependent catalytic subunit [Paenibacillus cellulosilyticus]
MVKLLDRLRKGYGRKLVMLHAWNGWIVVALAVTGLILLGGFWREILGEGRVWIKEIHIVVGIGSLVPVLYYLLLAGKHWKQLRDKPWQRFNVLFVLALLVGWLASGVLLWQFRAVGPRWSNPALTVHDLLTWIGLPYIIYHSITRTQWLKEPNRRTVSSGRRPAQEELHPASMPQPFYTRRSFIRGSIAAGLAVLIGPSFLKWIGKSLGGSIGGNSMEQLLESDSNDLVPAPLPLAASSPPIGGGSSGHFRVYTVTPIPSFDNNNWSFTVDGLVEKKLQFTWEQFVKLKRKVQVSDFHCVTGWSVYHNTWEGIPLRTLLAEAGVKSEAQYIKFYSGDGVYTDALSLEQVKVQMSDVMVAVMHDGKPIPSDLGGPVRLIVPQMYAYKSVKWLVRIELIADSHVGYWEQRGYSNDAWV